MDQPTQDWGVMKSHVPLLQTLLCEWGEYCGTDTSRDERYILERYRKEGFSFLTITLPTFDKALLRALDNGRVSSDLFQGFALNAGGLPRLFSGFLRNVFDTQGVLRSVSPEMIESIRAVRQICNLYSKIEESCSPARTAAAFTQYETTDAEIPVIPRGGLEIFQRTFHKYFGSYLGAVERTLYTENFVGRHGPGAVQDRTSSNGKYACNTWTERLEKVFPAIEALSATMHDYLDQEFQYLSVEQEPPVRVICVPKTMKGPRIIAIEPIWMQYVQQGIFHVMTEQLANYPWINKTIGWTDQVPNRELARDWERYATIDLSEASDRVPLQLVETALHHYPFLREAVMASRSTSAELPNGKIIRLKKFASMGSALCFPIETLVFATCVLMAYEEFCPTGHRYRKDGRDVPPFRVFGDDIVITREHVPVLMLILESYGFKVNASKSFWKGSFRESCGAEWFHGFDVSVVKVRQSLEHLERRDIDVVKAVALHNRLFEKGLFRSAEQVAAALARVGLAYYAPYGSTSCALWTYDLGKVRIRYDTNLHTARIKCLKVRFTLPFDPLDHWGALRKFFLGKYHTDRRAWHYNDPMALPQVDNLERAGRPLHAAIHVGWGAP